MKTLLTKLLINLSTPMWDVTNFQKNQISIKLNEIIQSFLEYLEFYILHTEDDSVLKVA